jgi:predicted Zn-dependent peptidase
MCGEIKKLLDSGVTDEELNRAGRRMLLLLPFYIGVPDDIGSIVFESIRTKEPVENFDKKVDRILAVTKDDVLRVAKKYFTFDTFMIVVDGPIEAHSLDPVLAKSPR